MRVRIVLAALVAVAPCVGAVAQDKKAEKKKPEPKLWMTKKGDLLWEESFAGATLPKEWHKGDGTWTVEEGVLRGAEKPADNHHAYVSKAVAAPDAIIQFSFKLDGAGWMGAFFDGKEHVAALTLGKDDFKIARMSGIGPTSKRTDVDSTRMKLNDGQWHTVVWEFLGDEVVASVDDQQLAIAKAEGLSMDRKHVELNTAGGGSALFKDLKVWKALPDDAWPRKRPVIFQLTKKKPAAQGYKVSARPSAGSGSASSGNGLTLAPTTSRRGLPSSGQA